MKTPIKTRRSSRFKVPFMDMFIVPFMIMVVIMSVFMSSTVFAKNVKYRKVQEVSFEETDIDGQVRNPDGAYLVQKRGVDFMPLYKVKKNFDDSLKDSVEYLK
jgi:hypothetical protein